ncbi:sestrin-2 isoform X2 [Clarias gariepinus]|uniref:sestrin-2 isoform X2 n=1 Tax=Clarias gariepinus TaxID=13013 RepID=UPI00234D5EBB|nr:sestrin-2 isoform X2 [Clarias gariepinus]
MKEEGALEVLQPLSSGPSAFIPAEVILNKAAGQEVLADTLLSVTHADNVTAVMGMHPTYLNCFLRTQNALLQPDGPLPLSWRHYIIIMASARHQCSYLVQLHSSAFLLAGGDESWLRGIHCAPQKLQCLQTLNKLLAHRPWLITQAHIQELVCPGAEPRWSLAELIQAVVLISHAHSLASFIWGCGIHPEPDSAAEQTSPPPSSAENNSTLPSQDGRAHRHKWTEAVNEVQLLMEKMMMVQQQEEEFTQEEMVTRFERERTESLLEPAEVGRSVLPDSVSRFVRDADFIYQDFSPRGEQAPPTMRAQTAGSEPLPNSSSCGIFSSCGGQNLPKSGPKRENHGRPGLMCSACGKSEGWLV